MRALGTLGRQARGAPMRPRRALAQGGRFRITQGPLQSSAERSARQGPRASAEFLARQPSAPSASASPPQAAGPAVARLPPRVRCAGARKSVLLHRRAPCRATPWWGTSPCDLRGTARVANLRVRPPSRASASRASPQTRARHARSPIPTGWEGLHLANRPEQNVAPSSME